MAGKPLELLAQAIIDGRRVFTVEAGDEMSIGIEVLGPIGGWARDEPVSLRMTVTAFGIIGSAESTTLRTSEAGPLVATPALLRRSEAGDDEPQFLVDWMADMFGEIRDGFVNARDEMDEVDLWP